MLLPLTMGIAIISLLLAAVSGFMGLSGLGVLSALNGKISPKVGKVVGAIMMIVAILFVVTFARGILPALGIGGTSSARSEGSEKNPIYIYGESYDGYYDVLEEYGDKVWFEYQPYKYGQFNVSVSDCDSQIDIDVYDARKNHLYGVAGMNPNLTVQFDGGETYYIGVTVYGYDSHFTVRVRQGGAAANAQWGYVGYNDVSFKLYNEAAYVKFVPDESRDYVIALDSNKYVNLTLCDENDYQISAASGNATYAFIDHYLDAGKTYYIKVELTDFVGSVGLNIVKDDGRLDSASEIYEGSSRYINPGYGYNWIKFTPNYDGTYEFTHSSTGKVELTVYSGLNTDYMNRDSIYSNDYFAPYLYANTTYYIKVEPSSSGSFYVYLNY